MASFEILFSYLVIQQSFISITAQVYSSLLKYEVCRRLIYSYVCIITEVFDEIYQCAVFREFSIR